MVLDSLGVEFRRLGVKPETDQESQNDLVPIAAFLGKRTTFVRQKNRAILRASDQPSRASRSSAFVTVGARTPSRAAISTGRASPCS